MDKKKIKEIKKGAGYTKTDQWIHDNFTKLVDKYGGKCIAVIGTKVAGVDNVSLVEAEKKAQKKHPKASSSSLRVPKPEEFICAL